MTMKIREIRAVGLRGATPEGGWSDELRPDDCVHTLIAVITDEGVTGLGSVFTQTIWSEPRWHSSSRSTGEKTRWSRNG